MRRRGLIVLLFAASFVVGCGSSSSSSSNPVATEMSYLPAGSPVVVTVATDPNGAAIHGVNGLLGQFSFASIGIGALKQRLQTSGINYDVDLKPLFGNPVALSVSPPSLTSVSAAASGGASASSLASSSGENVLIVWVTKDGEKLKSLLAKAEPSARRIGEHDGASVYDDGSTGALAIDGSTLIFAGSVPAVQAALDRHKNGGGMTEAQFKGATSSLPEDAVVNIFGDIGGLLNSQGLASARQVPWVAAIHSYAEAITASASGLKLSLHLDTSGAQLTDAQLPFAPGSTAPALASGFPLSFGIHDPAHIVQFGEAAERTSNPVSYSKFEARQAALRAKTGADLNSLVNLLTGDLIIASDFRTIMGRVTVSDPVAAADVLDKLATNDTGKTTLRKTTDGWLYVTKRRSLPVVLVGNQLAVGEATVPELKAFATAPTAPASGAQGTVAYRVGLSQLLSLLLHGAGSAGSTGQLLGSVLGQLSDITGWASVSPSQLLDEQTIGVH